MQDGEVLFRYIDQRRLPGELVFGETHDWRRVVDAVKTLAVRGAPAIGVAGASALALWAAAEGGYGPVDGEYRHRFGEAAAAIAGARPTAVNLAWAVQGAREAVEPLLTAAADSSSVADALIAYARDLAEDDVRTNRAIGRNGAPLIAPGSRILTHCNAGSLATVHYGTALGVVYAAAEQGRVQRVYADETRPVGQGSRLTVWELSRAGVPVTLICDDMAASVMGQGLIDCVIVGADRIARNGDTANKIGTRGVAVLAAYHGIPFYVAAPSSTIDGSLADGSGIVIEQRDPSEVLSQPLAGVDVLNPAFDVTPASLIAAIITEQGVWAPRDLESQL